MRLHVDKHGIVQPRPVGRPDRLLPIYRPGAVVEVDTGQGTCLADYHAEIIAESLHACSTVHLISDAADGSAPVIEHGTAFNADGVLRLLRQAIERAAAARGNAAC